MGTFNLNEVKILPPVLPSKIVCVGLNYIDHARELNMQLPDEPVIFIKPSTGVIGHLDSIIYPLSSKQVDYEVEIAVVFLKTHIKLKRKMLMIISVVIPFLMMLRLEICRVRMCNGPEPKASIHSAPSDPAFKLNLIRLIRRISLKLNDKIKQQSNTKNMIFQCSGIG